MSQRWAEDVKLSDYWLGFIVDTFMAAIAPFRLMNALLMKFPSNSVAWQVPAFVHHRYPLKKLKRQHTSSYQLPFDDPIRVRGSVAVVTSYSDPALKSPKRMPGFWHHPVYEPAQSNWLLPYRDRRRFCIGSPDVRTLIEGGNIPLPDGSSVYLAFGDPIALDPGEVLEFIIPDQSTNVS